MLCSWKIRKRIPSCIAELILAVHENRGKNYWMGRETCRKYILHQNIILSHFHWGMSLVRTAFQTFMLFTFYRFLSLRLVQRKWNWIRSFQSFTEIRNNRNPQKYCSEWNIWSTCQSKCSISQLLLPQNTFPSAQNHNRFSDATIWYTIFN